MMTENEWLPLAAAAGLRDDDSWLKRIHRGLVLGAVMARGVIPSGIRSDIPRDGELVEIAAREFANLSIDFLRSHLVPIDRARWRVPAYAAVEVRRADVERLAKQRDENGIDADIPAQHRSLASAPISAGSETASADPDTMPELLWNDWDQPHWSLNLALSWIAFRDAGAPRSREERMSAIFTALTYREGEGVIGGNPVRSLMLALRTGDPIAFDENGQALSPEFWAHRGFDERKWPPVVFRQKDMLRLWPNVKALAKNDGSPKGAAPPEVKMAARKARMSDTDIKRKLPPFLKQLQAELELQVGRFNQQIAKEVSEAHFMKTIDRSRFRAVYKDAGLNQKGGRPRKIPPKS